MDFTYTLSEVEEKMQQFADKNGSDYFQLPELMNHFRTATLEFVGEKLRSMEKTQEVVDDIRPLIVPGKLAVIADPDDTARYIAALPLKYMRLVSYDIIYEDGSKCRRADLKTQSQYTTAVLNPNQRPTKHYPIILQENGLFQIDCGTTVAAFMKIFYCKKPSFAKVTEPERRIVNLPDESIENIILSTVMGLYGKTADERVQIGNQFEQMFRKVNQS